MQILSSHSRKGVLAYVVTPLGVAVWFAISSSGLVDQLVLPSPLRVLQAVTDIGPVLIIHIAATVARVVLGFLLSVAAGLLIGVWMQRSRPIYALLDGLIETWRPVPPVALVPFFLLVFGFSEVGRMVLVVLGGTLIATVTVVEALHKTPPTLLQFGLVSGLSKDQLFRLILIPAAVPRLFAGFRIALALVFSLVIVSEFLGASYGLGYLISVAKVTLTTSTMLLCTTILGMIGYLSDASLRQILSRMTAWEASANEAPL